VSLVDWSLTLNSLSEISATSPNEATTALYDSVSARFVATRMVLALVFIGIFRVLSHFLPQELIQVPLFGLAFILFLFGFYKILPRGVFATLALAPILATVGSLHSRGFFGDEGTLLLFRSPGETPSPVEEQLRVEYNRVAEALGFDYVKVISRDLSNNDLRKFLDKRKHGALVPHPNRSSKLLLSLGSPGLTPRTITLEHEGRALELILLPEEFDFSLEPVSLSQWYLAALSDGISAFHSEKRLEDKLSEFGAALRFAGAMIGTWTTPVPRAAALFSAASSDLALLLLSDKKELGELRCLYKDFHNVRRKLGKNHPRELESAYFNNMGILELIRGGNKNMKVRKYFERAVRVGTQKGKVTEAAKIANINLLALAR